MWTIVSGHGILLCMMWTVLSLCVLQYQCDAKRTCLTCHHPLRRGDETAEHFENIFEDMINEW